MNSIYLEHTGVPGMKWGIRRFQNKDGSLTSAGKKRYKEIAKERVSKMSDAELDRKYNRIIKETNYLRAEQQYLDITSKKKGKSLLGKALKIAINDVVIPSAISVGRQYVQKEFRKMITA